MLRPLLLAVLLPSALKSAAPAHGQVHPTPLMIEVGLTRSLASATSLEIECDGAARVSIDGKRVETDDPAGKWRVIAGAVGVDVRAPNGARAGEGRRCLFAPGDGSVPFRLSRPGAGKPTRYRGEIDVAAAPEGTRLLVVDRLPLEDYLRGVVPSEMPPTAAAAALQAQAVCARSYALKLRQSGKFASRGYDLNDTTMCQAYGGVDAEKPSTDQAVRETAGKVLLRNGAVVWADYCDDCGGCTAPGDSPDDYPPAVLDLADDGTDLCAASPHHLWSLTLTPEDLAKRLGSASKGTGRITSVEILERDETGRVRVASIVGEDGEATVKGAALRATLGYEELRSTRFGVVRGEDGSFTFSGRGNGHGRGLCQWGAMALAKPPKALTCAQILDHYFPGAVLGSAPPEPRPPAQQRPGNESSHLRPLPSRARKQADGLAMRTTPRPEQRPDQRAVCRCRASRG